MPKFVIERDIAGIGASSDEQLKGISQASCNVLGQLGLEIQWEQSYITGDKIYCIYNAPSEELIKEHARLGGFPANRISKVENIISPATAEEPALS